MYWVVIPSLGPTHSLGEQGKPVSTETMEMSSLRSTTDVSSVCFMTRVQTFPNISYFGR